MVGESTFASCSTLHSLPGRFKHLLLVVDTNEGGTRRNETGHWAFLEDKPLKRRQGPSNRRVEEVKRVARFASQAYRTRRDVLCSGQ